MNKDKKQLDEFATKLKENAIDDKGGYQQSSTKVKIKKKSKTITKLKKKVSDRRSKRVIKTKRFSFKNIIGKGFLYIILLVLFLPFLLSFFTTDPNSKISLSNFISDVREDKVEKIEIAGNQLRVKYKDGENKIALKEDGQDLIDVFKIANIDLTKTNIEVSGVSLGSMLWELLISFLPVLLMIGVFFFIFRQAKGGSDGILGIGKSKAKIFIKGKQDTKFTAVGGMDEAKKELEEVVDFLKHPKKYQKVGARTPKGVLLVGPAGTGKTLIARAVAGEANVQFLSIAGSEFMEMLVGVGASRVRDLFATAKKLAPAIIFIDEIDAIGRARGRGNMGGHDEREQTLNQILVEMDGFSQNDNVIVMAATNRGDMLDPALIRPGRFDRRVMVSLPDLEERKFIINIHAKNKPFVKDIAWDRVAKRTVGFSGADIENMLNEAAIAVAREKREKITFADIEEAALKVKLGPSKKRLHDELEKKMTAYHEIGHSIIAHVLPHADAVHRVSIISRGHALGFTLTPPEKDKLQLTKSEILDDIAVLLGGRTAEKLIFNELTAGASNDIQKATKLARSMVTDYGMSKLGPMSFSPQYDVGYSTAWGEPAKISQKLQEAVDEEIRLIIKQQQERVTQLLTKYKKLLDKISMKLVEVESLDGDEFVKLMGMPKVK